ncbi:hypothetical protein [Streptomyces sp. NPDC046805]|uniref:hypothetical protein n=1 Tax=Streptomyces sp. NPDC046805 TaxID=3155134 RepID=UPI0033C20221
MADLAGGAASRQLLLESEELRWARADETHLTPAAGALLDSRLLGAMGRWTWGAGAPERPVAIALLAPPPQAGRTVARAVRALAESAGMTPASEPIPDIGQLMHVSSASQLAL